jgi:hypothetical protein
MSAKKPAQQEDKTLVHVEAPKRMTVTSVRFDASGNLVFVEALVEVFGKISEVIWVYKRVRG